MKIGSRVIVEATEEESFTGILRKVNQRYGYVEIDGKEAERFALSKIEPLADEGTDPGRVRCSSGRLSRDNGDDVASLLRGLTIEEVYTIVSNTMKVRLQVLKAAYSTLEPGRQRMCLGNRLRGYLKNQQAA